MSNEKGKYVEKFTQWGILVGLWFRNRVPYLQSEKLKQERSKKYYRTI